MRKFLTNLIPIITLALIFVFTNYTTEEDNLSS